VTRLVRIRGGLSEAGGKGPAVLVVPGEEVALHWLDLPPDLTRPQAAAAARLMAGELSAEPIAAMHVAAGRDEGGRRCVALVPAARMEQWLAEAAAAGIDPVEVVPETLLLPEPEEGFVRYANGAVPLYRGRGQAFALEPELAVHIVGEAEVRDLEPQALDPSHAPLDLRQGPFARRRAWSADWRQLRRMALLGLTLAAATIAVQIADILRYTYAADRIETEAREVLGGEDLRARLDAMTGPGAGFGATSGALFAAVRETPNLELGSMAWEGGALRATLLADQPATMEALRGRVAASGLLADLGPVRSAGGRQSAELVLRAP
jgi:general secretion pathway protein L